MASELLPLLNELMKSLGRGTQIEGEFPSGELGSSSRMKSDDRVVEKADPAYVGMGMPPRTRYSIYEKNHSL